MEEGHLRKSTGPLNACNDGRYENGIKGIVSQPTKNHCEASVSIGECLRVNESCVTSCQLCDMPAKPELGLSQFVGGRRATKPAELGVYPIAVRFRFCPVSSVRIETVVLHGPTTVEH
jgi:hypothetical protein